MELNKTHQTLQKAINLHRAGKFSEAKIIYENILKLKPDHPDANHNLGVLLVANGKVDQSLNFFKAAIDANPNITQFWLSYIETLIKAHRIGLAVTCMASAENHGISGQKLDILRKRLKESDHNIPDKHNDEMKESLFHKDSELSKQQLQELIDHFKIGDFHLVLDKVNGFLQFFPNSVSLYNLQGAAYAELKQLDNSIASYQSILKIQPNLAEAHFNLGTVLQEKLQFEDAISAYRSAIKIKPNFFTAYFNLGNIYKTIEKIDDAIAAYQVVIRLMPNHADALFALGILLSIKGDFNASINFYKKTVSSNPRYFMAYFNMGVAFFEKGYLDEAIQNYQMSIKINPTFSLAFNNLANAFKEKNDFSAALKYFNDAINIKPDFVEAHLNLATLLQESGDLGSALEHYKRVIALNPSNQEAHRKLAVLLKEIGKLEASIESFNQALKFNPNDSKTYYGLAEVYSSSGELAKSATYYEKCIEFAKDPEEIKKAESLLLKTLYFLGDEHRFITHLTKLISRNQSNSVIGSFACRAGAKFDKLITNSFCNRPLDYVVEKSLLNSCDFEETFVAAANQILQSANIQNKNQPLLLNGQQTAGNVFASDNHFSQNIKKIIEQEIEKYRYMFKDSTEGLITQWPSSYRLSGWLVSYKTGGAIRPHMHENGWISGSVYINVPPRLKNDDGSLVVCIEDPKYAAGVNDKLNRTLNVVTGSMCLFPASLLHYTIPFQANEDRVVLAFDVIRQ